MRRQDTELKINILKLRQEGKSVKQIKEILHCSSSTIAYHTSNKTKETSRRQAKRYRSTPKNVLKIKFRGFFRIHKSGYTQPNFNFEELLDITKNGVVCYLSGEKIDIGNSSNYALDHKIPISRGGSLTLENLGFTNIDINQMKHDKTPEEFIEMCKKVLIYNGYKISK